MREIFIEEIKCGCCHKPNYIDVKILSKPLIIHCTYCTSVLNKGNRVKGIIE